MRKTCILVTLTFVVTLTLGSRSRIVVYMLAGYEMHLSTKYEVNPTNGLTEMAVLVQKCEKITVSAHLFSPGDLDLGTKVTKTSLQHAQDIDEAVY